MSERKIKRVQIRTVQLPADLDTGQLHDGKPAIVSVAMADGEYVAGFVPAHGFPCGIMVAKVLDDVATTKPEPEPNWMRLCHALLHLDAGKRVSRMTWGCCFLVIENGEILVYEPTSIRPKGWWVHRVGDLPLDSDDLLADDWYVVGDAQFAKWDKDVQGES